MSVRGLRLHIKGKIEPENKNSARVEKGKEERERGKKKTRKRNAKALKGKFRSNKMRPLFGVEHAAAIPRTSSSNTDPADRRINALVRHLVESSSSAMADSLSASVASSLHSDSVFAHVVRAPEDPILGVFSFSSSFDQSL